MQLDVCQSMHCVEALTFCCSAPEGQEASPLRQQQSVLIHLCYTSDIPLLHPDTGTVCQESMKKATLDGNQQMFSWQETENQCSRSLYKICPQ